jgi:YggT family protein
MVRPLGRLLTVRGRWDVAALVALLVLASTDAIVMRTLMGPASGGPASLVPAVLALVLHWGLNLVLLIVLVSALLGLVNPHAPLAPGFDALARPILAPVRRALPRLRGIDLSPLVVLVVLQVLFLVLAPYVP